MVPVTRVERQELMGEGVFIIRPRLIAATLEVEPGISIAAQTMRDLL